MQGGTGVFRGPSPGGRGSRAETLPAGKWGIGGELIPGLHRPFPNPIGVEHLASFLVEAFVGVGTEVVALEAATLARLA